MESNRINEQSKEVEIRETARILMHGLHQVVCTNRGRIAALIYVLVCLSVLWLNPVTGINNGILWASMIIIGVGIIVYLGRPLSAVIAERHLKCAGIVDDLNNPPRLLGIKRNGQKLLYMFKSVGIPLSLWIDKQDAVKSALDVEISDIYEAKGKQIITVECIRAKKVLPESIPWSDEYLPQGEKLALGISQFGQESIDLNTQVHTIIGGSTGSGKTVLLKLLLYQAIRKEWKLYVADFKGTVDFPYPWKRYVRFMIEKHDVIKVLDTVISEMQSRKSVFRERGIKNIEEYNHLSEDTLPRIIVGCDEVAEMMDKAGATKEEKCEIDTIIKQLSSIARLGRAFGIHLIMGTQRPDATILQGQISNNCDFRICGKANDVLSQIVLDSTAAAKIPKHCKGRFVTNEGKTIQTYFFDDKFLR